MISVNIKKIKLEFKTYNIGSTWERYDMSLLDRDEINNEMQNRERKPYIREAKYYETDQMAVIHHSNYIRWFEEARVDYLDQIGLGFDRIEEAGVYSPVLSVTCEYKSSVRFKDQIEVIAKLTYFNGIKMEISYQVFDVNTKQLRATGMTKHCFTNKEYKPISLKKEQREMYDKLIRYVESE